MIHLKRIRCESIEYAEVCFDITMLTKIDCKTKYSFDSTTQQPITSKLIAGPKKCSKRRVIKERVFDIFWASKTAAVEDEILLCNHRSRSTEDLTLRK